MDFSWLVYPVSFVMTLGIVVTIHEFGHFIVARWAGVQVLRFAVGFGKPLLSRYDKFGTEFCLCAIPLGGYVRLLDARHDTLTSMNESGDLSSKSVAARLAIYAAGPAINFLLAIIIYGIVALFGVTHIKPVIGLVEPNSPAYEAGLAPLDELVSIRTRAVTSWEQVSFEFIEAAGLQGVLEVEVARQIEQESQVLPIKIALSEFMVDASRNPLSELGIVPQMHLIPARLGLVSVGMPAETAGWQIGDLITRLDDQPILFWRDLVEYIQRHPKKTIAYTLERDGRVVSGFIQPDAMPVEAQAAPVGKIGAGPQAPEVHESQVQHVQYGPLQALFYGLEQTWVRTRLVVLAITKLFTGALSLDNVTGPVTIAEIAGKTAQVGVSSSLGFLAYLSISLGVFNLLPIPVLDGGHILYGLIELVRGRALSLKVQQQGVAIGFMLLGSLTALALFNDITRLLAP